MFYSQWQAHPNLYILPFMALYCLVCPIIIHGLVEILPNPRPASPWFFAFDGINAGLSMAVLNFALIPSLFVTSLALTNMLILGGLRGLALQAVIVAVSSMAAFSFLPIGPQSPNPELALYSTVGLAFYAMLAGFSIHLYIERLRKLSRKLREQGEQLERQSRTDPLTGVNNRRHFHLWLKERTGHIRAFVLVDLDHFKSINDRHGHEVGDLALKLSAQKLSELFPSPHQLVRWGGEEFLLAIIAEQDYDLTFGLGQILETLNTHPILLNDGKIVHVTCSAGAIDLHQSIPWEQAIRLADLALFQAKKAGRNRAILLQPGPSGYPTECSSSLAELIEQGRVHVQVITPRPITETPADAQEARLMRS